MRLALIRLFLFCACRSNSPSHHSRVTAMRLIVQRVKSASVTVRDDVADVVVGGGEGGGGTPRVLSSIGPGILALVGLHVEDDISDLSYCARRLLNVKLWESEMGNKPWRRHVRQLGYEVLCVSQFTLYGTLSRKHQPDYKLAMKSDDARCMYDEFLTLLRNGYDDDGGRRVHDGAFGRMMDVESVNDGPVTLVIDSREGRFSDVGGDVVVKEEEEGGTKGERGIPMIE
jgi:D-tyrosyl-tRNA(Tyr) deacylase